MTDPADARVPAQRLVDRARAVGDRAAQTAALRALAESHRRLVGHAEAGPLLEEAVRIARRHRLDSRLGEALLTRGLLRLELGRWDDAQADLDQAAELLGADGAVDVDVARAAVAQNAGRLRDAADTYARVLRRKSLTPLQRARAANNLGLLEAQLGNHAAADRWLDEAAKAATVAGQLPLAVVAETRAWATVRAGHITEGMRQFDEAIELWQRAERPLGELYADYADALANLRLLPEAREQAEHAAAALLAQGVDLVAVEAQLRAADLALATGDPETAERMAEETIERLRRQRRADWRSRAHLVAIRARLACGSTDPHDHSLALRAASTLVDAAGPLAAAEAYLTAGRVAERIGRRPQAIQSWERAAELAPNVPVLARLTGRLARALAARAGGDDEELLRVCRQALADLAQHRAALPTTELRALASGHGAEFATLGFGAVRRTRPAGQVLAWMERTRATALQAVGVGPVSEAAGDLAALRAVQTEITRARRSDRNMLPALLGRRSALEARIRQSTWAGASAVQSTRESAFSAKALRERLAGRVLVEYDLHADRVVAAVVEPRRTRIVDLDSRDEIEGEVDALRSSLHALNAAVPQMAPFLHDTARELVQRVRELLVEPLGVDAEAGVVVIPVGELQRVPWSALFDRPVSVAPSASTWLAGASRTPASERVLLAAGPGLRAAPEEIADLAGYYPDATLLAPPDSTVEAVKHALPGAALAHLSCHGEVRTDNPTFSSLRFTDGNLTVHELDRHGGVPHRMVLAACDVGGSVTYPGNEVLGFIGTLLGRGTAGVVASTMLVLDSHVAPLMVGLHQGLLAGQTLADALHAARSALDLEDPKAYPAWCSFTAYGAG